MGGKMHQQEVKLKVGKSGSREAEEFRKEDSPRILVVDDSVETLMLLTDILANNGYKILTASDGHTALKLVEVEVPDLIILDVKMPNMDGYEVCHKLKSDEHSSRIPVIFISVPFGDGGNPSPLGEEKFIYCRYATLSTWSTYKERPQGSLNLDTEIP